MRVLFVVHQFFPEFASGTEKVTLALAKAVQRAGHRAEILTCSLDPAAEWDGLTPQGFRRARVDGLVVTGIPSQLLGGYFGFVDPRVAERGAEQDRRAILVAAVDAFLQHGAYDLVHVTHSLRMPEVVERVRAACLPYVLTLTDFFLLCYRVNLVRKGGARCDGPEGGRQCARHCRREGLDLLLLEQRQAAMLDVLRGAALRVACSGFVADAFAREYPDLPVTVIGHGIDLLRIIPRPPRPAGTLAVGYVGTLSAEKGVDLLARAFTAAPGDMRLDLVGPMAGGQGFADEMEWLAAQDARIRLHGPVPPRDVPATLAGFDVLCLPTRLPETFSLALHEGFAAGLPALVSDLGHPAGVVREAGCGRVLPSGDEPAWAAALGQLARDPALLEEWRARLPLPARVEEETFLYSQLYKACIV